MRTRTTHEDATRQLLAAITDARGALRRLASAVERHAREQASAQGLPLLPGPHLTHDDDLERKILERLGDRWHYTCRVIPNTISPQRRIAFRRMVKAGAIVLDGKLCARAGTPPRKRNEAPPESPGEAPLAPL